MLLVAAYMLVHKHSCTEVHQLVRLPPWQPVHLCTESHGSVRLWAPAAPAEQHTRRIHQGPRCSLDNDQLRRERGKQMRRAHACAHRWRYLST